LCFVATIIAEETAFGGDLPRLPDNLVNFDVSFSFFTGGLTDVNFEGLNQINFIDLEGNAFNSTVPTVFGRLPSLQYLYLSDSFISGDLSYMNGMSSIIEHWADTNPGLSGPVFDFIGSIPTLESWYSNQLTGQIPASLGNLGAMTILQLEGNSFSGSMPDEICANTQFPTMVIEILGADCEDPSFNCSCCTCCSVLECNGA
jgi:hypothetical protein